jgi:hypothetical protein
MADGRSAREGKKPAPDSTPSRARRPAGAPALATQTVGTLLLAILAVADPLATRRRAVMNPVNRRSAAPTATDSATAGWASCLRWSRTSVGGLGLVLLRARQAGRRPRYVLFRKHARC